jgi:hypothetical protein
MMLAHTRNHFYRNKRSDTITFRRASKPHVAERTVANPAHKLV